MNCKYSKNCGGCSLIDIPYNEQLKRKQKEVSKLLAPFCRNIPIIGMDDPYHYRNKVHAVYSTDRKKNIISGTYEEGSHKVVPIDSCLIENEMADKIIVTIRELLPSFKLTTYNEDTGRGFLRHVLIRTAHQTEQIMVVMVTGDRVFPSRKNFVKALLAEHPEITTIVQNVNNRKTSMILGEQQEILYGKGYIEDVLCGRRFLISPKSFYQVNSVQTEKLYNKAMDFAGLTGNEEVIDAYCGIGTIGLVAAGRAASVLGIELNKTAVKDAIANARLNGEKNIRFICDDAGEYMRRLASEHVAPDVVFMDPPRTGSDEKFLNSLVKMGPDRIVYISCDPKTLARDLKLLTKKGYTVKKACCVDLFPSTTHIETVVLLSRMNTR